MTKINLLENDRDHGRLAFFCAMLMITFLISTFSQAWVDQGNETAPGEFSAVFGFRTSETDGTSAEIESICTGFLVSPSLILTAAHCVLPGKHVTIAGNGIRIGSSEGGAATYSVKKSKSHPNYTTAPDSGRIIDPEFQASIANDIGYLLLKNPITDVKPLPIFVSEDLSMIDAALSFHSITTVGYGADSFNDVLAQKENNSLTLRTGVKKKGTRTADEIHGAGLFLTVGDRYGVLPGDSGGPFLMESKGETIAVAIAHAYAPGTRIVTETPSDSQRGKKPKTHEETIYAYGAGTLMTLQNLCWVVRDSGMPIPGVDCSKN